MHDELDRTLTTLKAGGWDWRVVWNNLWLFEEGSLTGGIYYLSWYQPQRDEWELV